ncbi:LysR family transcriptional regulator [Enhygromyxa salina]|uniref:Putative hydrogen peroxide-inducible protein activator n=1 Tax=Enhygromyxa salina TaxID=215803 RepID=A0A2S9Y7Z3_9BACT|nr:LysR family transcriptional regulator [Enhygromyxa salina]PRQ01223.1 putative hydrogen peroxide-inducible protein activator [Enhygromyxa salina]
MELSQLRALIAVLDSGSVLHASKALKVSRGTLYARMTALEENLGLKLLVSTNQGVIATDYGRQFAAEARALLATADAMARAARRQRDELLGELYIRASVGLPPQLLMVLMRQIGKRHPELAVRFEITRDPAADLPADTDLVLHFAPAVPAGPFRTFVLSRFPEHLIASTEYLDAHGRPQTLEQLREHQLMSWCPPGEDGSCLPLLGGGSFPITPDLVSDQVYVLHCLAAAGHGIALLPDSQPMRHLIPGTPREVVLPDLVGRRSSLWALIPEAQADTPRSQAAARLIREVCSGVFSLHVEQIPEG